ncbi:MAG: PorV/PorQ family protein, partial [Syntrophothermus sp.]
MRKIIFISLMCFAFAGLSREVAFSQQKLAQAGMKFLLVSPDARIAGMGDANTAIESNNSSAIFLNPAGMARMQQFADVNVGQVSWIADIKYIYGAAAFAPFQGDYGVLALSFLSVNYGDLLGTVRDPGLPLGYRDLGTFTPKAYYFGVSYAKALNDKFAIGANIKYAVQDLTQAVVAVDAAGNLTYKSYKPSTVAYDFGMLYHTGIKSLDFGVSVRNFSKELQLERETYQLPLIFKVGLAFNMSDVLNLDKNEHSLQVAVDASHPRDNREKIDVGLEYKFMNMLSLRIGNSSPNDEYNLSYGLGFEKFFGNTNFGFDYS